MTSSAHTGFKIGYPRVSTIAQDEALQLDALQRAVWTGSSSTMPPGPSMTVLVS
jgi:hypothetical protein